MNLETKQLVGQLENNQNKYHCMWLSNSGNYAIASCYNEFIYFVDV